MNYRRNIQILSIITFMTSLAFELITPLWPIYIKSLNATMIELGLVFSISNVVSAVMQILSGYISDKYGRKRLHVLGTLLASFPPIIYSFAKNWFDLVPWVMFSGFATGLFLPIRWSIVADISSRETMASAYSWTNISMLMGSTIAPFIGGLIADSFGLRFPFYTCFILNLVIFPFTLLLQETKVNPREVKSKREEVPNYFTTLIMFSLINIIQGVGLGVISPVIPIFVVSNFHVDYTFTGLLYALGFGAASMIVQIPGGKLSNRFDRRKIMFLTFVASSPFFLLLAFSRNTLELIVFMFLSRAILNLHWSPFQTLMMDATPPSRRGIVNGVSAATFFTGLLIGNTLSGILWDTWGMLAPFYTSSLAILLSALPLLRLKETRKIINQD